jgi:DnaJ-class molecular chaperone
MTVEEKGMPFHKNPYRFGNLFVLFKVKSPEHISDSQAAEVR